MIKKIINCLLCALILASLTSCSLKSSKTATNTTDLRPLKVEIDGGCGAGGEYGYYELRAPIEPSKWFQYLLYWLRHKNTACSVFLLILPAQHRKLHRLYWGLGQGYLCNRQKNCFVCLHLHRRRTNAFKCCHCGFKRRKPQNHIHIQRQWNHKLSLFYRWGKHLFYCRQGLFKRW